jgi:hypothetical protein
MKTLPLLLATLALTASAHGHGHINAGAIDINSLAGIQAGDQLVMRFEHGTNNTALVHGQVTTGAQVAQSAAIADAYAWTGYTTLTALHQSTVTDDDYYDPEGASSGSFIELHLVSLSGTPGAKLAFYEAGATNPLWVYEIGEGGNGGSFLLGDGKIDLTEDVWFEDPILSDPYGHAHGRTFALSTSGNFTATWILQDREAGTTGLLDSAPFTSTFTAAAIPEPGTLFLASLGLVALYVMRRRLQSLTGKTFTT